MTMAAKKNDVQKTLDLAGEFVTKQGGSWEHADWEGFLKKADKIGIAIDDEGKRNLGNILEAAKFLYNKADIRPVAKSAKPKAKAKTKAKTKAKAGSAKKKPAKKKVVKKAVKKA
jgi:hypothetical protein